MLKTMFMPNFKYTNQIVNRLSKIAVAREVILNSPLVPKWQVSLRKEAIIRSAHSSTSIEGNRLNISQVSELAMGGDIMALRQVALSDRQMKIVEHLNRYQFITVGDMVKMFQITRQAALKEIGKLVELEVVRLVGQKRGARYILT